jgi:hypothetical protein
MKIVLTIFCVLLAVFGGGCAIMLGGQVGPLVLLPLGILVFNGLILAALWGWKKPWRPAFYILGVIDLLIALGLGIVLVPMIANYGSMDLLLVVPCAAFALKGVLTLMYARNVSSLQ